MKIAIRSKNYEEYKKKFREKYGAIPCAVCGKIDTDGDFVVFGIQYGREIKICERCDSYNWQSTFPR